MRITRFISDDNDRGIHFLPVVGYSYGSKSALFFGWLIWIWIIWFDGKENENT